MAKEESTNVLKQYAELKAKHPERMLLFRSSRYYQLFNEDAKDAVRILGINGVQFRNDPDTATALFEYEKLDIYLPKLIRAGKKVAICDMLPEPPKTKRGITETINNESTNNQTSEEKTMATKKNNNETKNVQNAAQVNNPSNETIDVNVGEVTVDSIMPVMQTEEPKPEEKPAVTVPLSEHGTLVVGGVPKRDKVTLKKKTPEAYRVVLVPSKDGSGQWPKLYGFDSEDAAEKMTKKMAKSIRNSWDRDEAGEKRFYIKAGKKYCDVFQELADALNSGDKSSIDKACKRSIAIYDGAVADGKAESAAKKAEREAAKAQENAKPAKPSGKTEKPATAAPAMSAEDAAMFDLFKKFMAGDKDAMAKVGAVLNKAA